MIVNGFKFDCWFQLMTDIKELYALRKKFLRWKDEEKAEWKDYKNGVTNCQIIDNTTLREYFKYERINTCWKTAKFEYWLKMEDQI
jgi:hypothetical protein